MKPEILSSDKFPGDVDVTGLGGDILRSQGV